MPEETHAYRARLEASLNESPFQRLLGLKLESFDLEARTVLLSCLYRPEVERGNGTNQFHGGVIASLIDVAGDYALMAIFGYGVPTINFRVDYLRPAKNTDLFARAHVRRAGRTVAVVDVEVTDSAGRTVALGRGCYGTQQG